MLLCAGLLAGCGADSPAIRDPGAGVDGSTLPGSYSGTFPCANCAGIDVTLWLTEDGVFFLRQDYASEGAEADRIHALGHWRWSPADATVTLAGRGPERELAYDGGERLELSTFADAPHVLHRTPSAAPFSDRVRLEGTYAPGHDGEALIECVTGLKLALRDDAGRRALSARHRALSRPDLPALTVVDAEFLWTDDGDYTIAVSELISMRPRTGCAG